MSTFSYYFFFCLICSCTYNSFESNSCDFLRVLARLADEKAIGLMSSSNESSFASPNDFIEDTFACGTVFG